MASQVSANVSFTGSITTLALYGTSNTATTAYVPQDFSSSGLNVSAFAVGNAASVSNVIQYSAFGPFAGEGSLYGGGGSGYGIKTPAAALDYNFGAMDYTFEAWIYITDLSSDSIIFNNAVVSLTISSPGKVRIAMISMVGSPYLSSTTSVATNGWYHVAATFTSATVRLFTNGVLTDTFTGVTGTPAYTSPQQMYIMSSTAFGSQFKGYLSNFRITRGLALYTTTFTPPTGPLQPIQGVTQAGLPYGTVLLLRNAPAPGRIQTTKFSGANSGQVLSFPPAAMTSYATALASGYGQGTYVASASTEYDTTLTAWQAFDKNSTKLWASAYGGYSLSTPYNYPAGATTVDVNGNSYLGEWLQIQKPSSIVLSSYSILNGGNSTKGLAKWWILGSRDGANWSLVDSQSSVAYSSSLLAYSVAAAQAFTYYRMVINAVTGSSGIVQLAEWTLNGSIESVNVTPDGRVGLGVVNPTRALEVAGDVVCAGTLSAGNPLMFRNRIINGDMRIAQRGTSSSAANYSSIDRWNMNINGGNITLATSSSVPPGQGFSNSSSLTINTTIAGGTSGAWYMNQKIEGYNVSDFGIGTATGQPFTASFWLQSSLAGTLSIFFQNSAEDRSYVTSITVGAVNSWTKYTITVPPVASGTWYNNNLTGITMGFGFYSIYNTGTPSTWVNSGAYWLTTATNYMVSGTTINITGVQLEKGSVATPFEVRSFATELALCQRYYYQWVSTSTFGVLGYATALNTTAALLQVPFPVQMRSNTPSANFTSSAVGSFATQGAAFGALSAIASTVDGNSLNMGTVLLTFATATAGQTVQVRANNSSTAFVAFNVEL